MTGFDQAVIDLINYEGNMKVAINRLKWVLPPVDKTITDEEVIDTAIWYIDRLKKEIKDLQSEVL